MADHRQQGEGEHHQRDVAVPAVPAARLVVIEAELIPGGLEAVLDRPAAAFDPYQHLERGTFRAPGGEERQALVGQAAPDGNPVAIVSAVPLQPGFLPQDRNRCVPVTPST